jgi:translation initiation factor IF-1
MLRVLLTTVVLAFGRFLNFITTSNNPDGEPLFASARGRAISRTMKEHGITSEFDGVVKELSASGFYRVVLDEGDGQHQVLARKSGRMSKFRIVVATGDRVKVEVSAYDTNRARIIHRYR